MPTVAVTLAKLWIPACARPGKIVGYLQPGGGHRGRHYHRNRPRLNILNNDGQPHPAENIAAILVRVSEARRSSSAWSARNSHTGPAAHVIATATGLAALLVGLYLQMVSIHPPNQRVVIVVGIIAGFVGTAIYGLSRGGFVG